MNEPTLQRIQAELRNRLTGQKFGKIFPLAKYRIAIDFRLSDGTYLFIAVEPNSPRTYLIERRLKTLEEQSGRLQSFYLRIQKHFANAVVRNVEKIADERVLKMVFDGQNELGEDRRSALLIQLTGRSSNLFLLGENDQIIESLRKTEGQGQITGGSYAPPARLEGRTGSNLQVFPQGTHQTLSAALDGFYLHKEADEGFRSKANSAKALLNKEIKKKNRLRKRLIQDLENHGDPGQWKHFGEVLLANVSTAERSENKIFAIDYFDPETPRIEIEAEEHLSVTEAAEDYFKRYGKARNAKSEISARLELLGAELAELEFRKSALNRAIADRNEDALESFQGIDNRGIPPRNKSKADDPFPGTKRYLSTDGFEILVGKRSKDNDFLTFRIAKSLDTWLHAADYPGSHVIIRNPNRKEIPHSTLLEAAGLAAFYSKAKNESKAAVHYTQKKFVNKPKGSAPGLVSLASFKTVIVKPGVPKK